MEERDFDLGNYLSEKRKNELNIANTEDDLNQFMKISNEVKSELDKIVAEECREDDESSAERSLERQRKALIGETREVEYYKNKIKEILSIKGYAGTFCPPWYNTLEDAVFNESYGYAGISQWIQGATEELKHSSACKTLGDRIYYKINGYLQLQPQTISAERRTKLREVLLLLDPRQNRANPYFEIYLNDGSRVTIFKDNGLAKFGQDSIVFRKYHVNVYTFEEQAKRHTIPEGAIEFFKSMVGCGFNVAFTGEMGSAKTTMMTTYQQYEDPLLEGVLIETDPEIPMHELMPTAPIMQLVPSEENMDLVIAQTKRSDANYVMIGEARDGRILNLMIEAANMGTKRSKVTFHNTETVDFCYDVAEKITRAIGGDIGAYMVKTAKSINYVFNMCSLPERLDQKRLAGLWEIRYDEEKMDITMHQICKYDFDLDDWVWANDIGKDKEAIAKKQNKKAFEIFKTELEKLAKDKPNKDNHVFTPPYIKIMGLGGMKK